MKWEIVNNTLPNGIVLYKGYNSKIPIKAWAVVIENKKKNIIKILASNDKDGLDSPENFANKFNATIVINGGYFSKSVNTVRHIGLLKVNNELIEPASGSVIRENIRYNVNRGAFGIYDDGKIDIVWASTKNDSIFQWDLPIDNRPGKPGILNYRNAKFWDVAYAMHAGPVLITNSELYVTSEEEVFFNSPVDGVQPRSAIGYNDNGDVIMMIVDGRQVDSRGVYLKELALLMSQFKCIEALNLDGGGSSALFVDGSLVNRPIGLNTQREVMSSIAVISKN
tara:strand:+ start:4948 stop:5790 length:843 start_codon:yes stop_codon:yes gene_type:complete